MRRFGVSEMAPFGALLVLCLATCVSSYPGGSAYYPCCCPDNPACREMGTSCFYCRNLDFTCNCAQCSCYTDDDDSDDTAAEDAFYADLLKRGFMKDYLRRHNGVQRQRSRRLQRHHRRTRRWFWSTFQVIWYWKTAARVFIEYLRSRHSSPTLMSPCHRRVLSKLYFVIIVTRVVIY
jgi:hypothetical protein